MWVGYCLSLLLCCPCTSAPRGSWSLVQQSLPGRRHGCQGSGCHHSASRTACGCFKSLLSSLWSWNSVAVSQWHSTPCKGGKVGHRLPCWRFVCMAVGLAELKAPRIQPARICFSPLSFVSLFLPWDLTREEVLESFVDFPAVVNEYFSSAQRFLVWLGTRCCADCSDCPCDNE